MVDAVLREVVEEDASLVASPVASHLLDRTHDELVSGEGGPGLAGQALNKMIPPEGTSATGLSQGALWSVVVVLAVVSSSVSCS